MPTTKKKYKPGAIMASREELAIVVQFEKEETTMDDNGNVLDVQKQSGVKKIPIKNIDGNTDLHVLAARIISENKLIHPSKKDVVESVLSELMRRSVQIAPLSNEEATRIRNAAARDDKIARIQLEAAHMASMEDLEDYLEGLYHERLEERIKATACIASLFRHADSLPQLLGHGSLVGALARVLAEDYQRSVDLECNILSCFFAISMFIEHHGSLVDNRVGELTLNAIKLELERSDSRGDESLLKTAVADPNSMSDKQRRTLTLSQKQDRMLYYGFYILLNFAEDVSIERKIRKREIVSLLTRALDRSNLDLILVVVQFLKKLSVFGENKDDMLQKGTVLRLMRFVPVRNTALLGTVLRTLHNLSFDRRLRDQMVQGGMVAKAVDLLPEKSFQPILLGLLYHVSVDDRHKPLFTYTGLIPMIRKYLADTINLRQTPELIALAVNLSQNNRNAEVISQDGYFDMIMNKALKTRDDLLFKVLRNISQVDNIMLKRMFKPYTEQLVRMLQEGDVHANVLVEALGILGNLNLPEFGFDMLVDKYNLITFLAEALQPEVVEDDILLEIIVFLSVLVSTRTAPKIVQVNLIPLLMNLIATKRQDDEFVLQIAYLFLRLLSFEDTSEVMMQRNDAISYLVDLCFDVNKAVRATASKAIDLVMEHDAELAIEIRKVKYERFNGAWLAAVQVPTGVGLTGRFASGGGRGWGGGEEGGWDASPTRGFGDQDDEDEEEEVEYEY